MLARAGRRASAPKVFKRLNASLAAEIARALRRKRMRRADLIAERIVRLGGEPDYCAVSRALRARQA